MSVLRSDALRMELHAMHGLVAMLQAHDHAIIRCCRYFEAGGHGGRIDGERVVARGFETVFDPAKHAAVGMPDAAELALHRRRRAHDRSTKGLSDRLMAEADAKDRDAAARRRDQFETDARAVRITGAGREHDRV